jgi:UDP-N-acetylglucosamine diphosphorylase/glucosamine-1-phosphate N-acetyltransferase
MATIERLLVVFDDERARRWSPFAESRPVGELRFGAELLRERIEARAGVHCVGHLCGTALLGWDEPGAAPCLSSEEVDSDRARLYWLSRAVADELPDLPNDRPATLEIANEVVGWFLPPGVSAPPAEALARPSEFRVGEAVELGGEVLAWPWSLVQEAPDRLSRDLLALYDPADDPGTLEGVHRLGDHGLSLGRGATIGPGVILDLREGPIRLEEGARIEGPARITGPFLLGASSIVFGGHLSRTATGPHCKLRGEIADTVFLGFANKAHDGYVGHALVGRWVNLGAYTTNSDLKNSYGNVRVELPHGRIDTDLMKVGAFLGDHVKTGIGTLLTTGAVVGAGSNVFGGGPAAPRHLPPFSWSAAAALEPFQFEKFVEVAQAAMGRRGHRLTPGIEAVMRRLWMSVHGVR